MNTGLLQFDRLQRKPTIMGDGPVKVQQILLNLLRIWLALFALQLVEIVEGVRCVQVIDQHIQQVIRLKSPNCETV